MSYVFIHFTLRALHTVGTLTFACRWRVDSLRYNYSASAHLHSVRDHPTISASQEVMGLGDTVITLDVISNIE